MLLDTYENMMDAYNALKDFAEKDTFEECDSLINLMRKWFMHHADEVEAICLDELRKEAYEKICEASCVLQVYDERDPSDSNLVLLRSLRGWMIDIEEEEKKKSS